MRHGYFGLLWVAWTVFLVWRLGRGFQTRRKDAERERIAAEWPATPGQVRGGSVRLADGRWRLELTYDAFESGQGIELWHHGFPTKLEAEHAKDALSGRACLVHYNPEREQDTTLLWSEVKSQLAEDPFVPQLVRLSRNGYRWLAGLAGVAGAGLLASVTLYAIAMAGSDVCVCDAMICLLIAGPVVMIASLAPMMRMLVVAPGRRLTFVLRGWGLWAMGIALLGMAVNLAHYGPMFRALSMDANVPDRVFAGSVGVLAIPMYLFASIVALRGLRCLRPVPVEAAVAATV